MEQAFCISDIHGCYEEFLALLEHWQRERELLVLVGDYIDRGPQSKEVVAYIQQLQRTYGEQVVVLQGNHDAMLLEFIAEPVGSLANRFLRNGGEQTLASFIGEPLQMMTAVEQAQYMMTHFADTLDYLAHLPMMYEWGAVLFTHAGFDVTKPLAEQTSHDLLWQRQHYIQENTTGRRNVFGHTPTFRIRQQHVHDIWLSEDGQYIGIDGGCVFDGQLNALRICKNGRIAGIEKEFKR